IARRLVEEGVDHLVEQRGGAQRDDGVGPAARGRAAPQQRDASGIARRGDELEQIGLLVAHGPVADRRVQPRGELRLVRELAMEEVQRRDEAPRLLRRRLAEGLDDQRDHGRVHLVALLLEGLVAEDRERPLDLVHLVKLRAEPADRHGSPGPSEEHRERRDEDERASLTARGLRLTLGPPVLGALLGNYRVIDALGEGGMGVVYIGRHETLGRRVVVKVLQPHKSRQSDMVERFFNDAQAATAINNPGIAQVFDFGMTPDGRAYFVMELLEGETLAARLRGGPLDAEACCRIGRQIANVLQAAHEAGITHRDLKPDNLFLVPDREVIGGERVKVLDFGLAKLANEARPVKTRTGLVMGTPSYMSPEQCRGISNADARSDIYALGCILFKMACGRAPFVGDGAAEVIVAHVNDPVPDPRQLAPGLPPALSTLIKKMLAKNPSSRPQTMAAISEAFDQILSTLSGAGARARTATPPAPAPPVPEDPASLTDAEPIRPPTLDDTVRTPAALPPSEALATTQFPVSSAGRPEAQPVPTSEIAGAAEPSLVPRL